ncbi:MAG: hypothetical protein JWP95_1663 [Actinotalea sp.]|nr:hypothetical protein [Actinotalea sp.]
MSPGDYSYPPDEFDSAAARVGPQGVHRAPRSRWSRWGPFVVVLVLFPVLAYGLVTWLASWDGLGGALPAALDDAPETRVSESPTAQETVPAETPVEEVPPPTETTPPPVADLSRSVEVYNATNTSGLAGSAADRVEEAGFTTVSADDWEGEDTSGSVVYYPAAADVATAQAVADALGITVLTESADIAGDAVVVVLADDYEG